MSLTMDKPKVCLIINELADVYALKTFYDYLVENRFAANLNFHNIFGNIVYEKLLQDYLRHEHQYKANLADADLRIAGYSDILSYFTQNIEIDLSLLKNCTLPVTLRKKNELRKKYNIDSKKPVIVIGCACKRNFDKDLEKVVSELHNKACIYLVGSVEQYNVNFLHALKIKNVNVINEFGVLKEYYSLADIAMMADNLNQQYDPLHNFVEATEGGPLFLVTPANKRQYGYRQLVDSGVINESCSTDELVKKVKKYLKSLNHNKLLQRKRKQHIEQTRAKYLPELLRFLNNALGISQQRLVSDLLVYTDIDECKKLRVKIVHPDTCWRLGRENDNLQKKITDLDKNFYKLFRTTS